MIESFLSIPQNFQNICKIYPPTVNQVLREETKGLINLLTVSQEELEDYFVDKVDSHGQSIIAPDPFTYIIGNSQYNKEFEKKVLDSFQLFLREPVSIQYPAQSIVIGDLKVEILKITSIENILKELRIINKDNFFEFQNALRKSLGDKELEPPNPNENPRIKQMKAKARYRDRIKAKKGNGITFEETLVSICCMGIGLNPLNIGEISYAASKKLIEKYQQKEKYDIDIRSLLAGADSKKIKVQYWMNKNNDK